MNGSSRRFPTIQVLETVEEINQSATGRTARRYRESAGIGLREMARKLDISASYLSDLERGNRNWNPGLIQRFNQALNIE